MKLRHGPLVVCLLGVMLTVGCGPAIMKPNEVVEQYLTALTVGDFDKASSFVSENIRKNVIAPLKAGIPNFTDQQKIEFEKTKSMKISILKTTEKDDKAQVSYTQGDFPGTLNLTKHAGKWIIE